MVFKLRFTEKVTSLRERKRRKGGRQGEAKNKRTRGDRVAQGCSKDVIRPPGPLPSDRSRGQSVPHMSDMRTGRDESSSNKGLLSSRITGPAQRPMGCLYVTVSLCLQAQSMTNFDEASPPFHQVLVHFLAGLAAFSSPVFNI